MGKLFTPCLNAGSLIVNTWKESLNWVHLHLLSFNLRLCRSDRATECSLNQITVRTENRSISYPSIPHSPIWVKVRGEKIVGNSSNSVQKHKTRLKRDYIIFVDEHLLVQRYDTIGNAGRRLQHLRINSMRLDPITG